MLAQRKHVKILLLLPQLNVCSLFFCEASLVLIFIHNIHSTAQCVILIMICATEKSEMVMS